ncbi:MAG: hypothetical protein GX330_02715, partial [Bacteroidales bacterium]|nr:hypothetical protein [Bacteroidales bacterium]
MKKLLLFMGVFFLFLGGYSQSRVTFSENFDGKTHSFTSIPANAWIVDSTLSVSGKNSCWGFIPNTEGDTVILESPLYDLTSYAYAYLRFTHICKVSENDLVTVEFREDHLSSRWKKLPANTYRGSSVTYRKRQFFNDMSYDAWMYSDFDAEPNNSWWKTENFDVSQEVSYARVQFRFKIAKGSTIGSQFAYGWLIDNFELIASSNEINPPIVELMDPTVEGKVFGTGPYQIVAKTVKQTPIPLLPPVLY